MCSDCGDDHEPRCDYCGESCYGKCDDPDTCRSCWFEGLGILGDELESIDKCIDEKCTCNCHEDLWEDLGYRFEAGVLKVLEDDGPPYEHGGVFPFLELPGEVREKIYGFSFLQDGRQRKTVYHRGSIHTALLGTCRQIYNEARHLPLTVNELCFASPVSAHDFLGFSLAPTQRSLLTCMHIEFHKREFWSLSWHPLMRELAKMPLNHLGLTLKGGIPKEQILGHTCFTNRFKELKHLKTLDFILASAHIKAQDKRKIQEQMREMLIKDYIRPTQLKKLKLKRATSADEGIDSSKAAKKAKSENSPTKHQAKIVASPSSGRLSIKSRNPERDAAKAAKQALLDKFDQVKQYATSLDADAAPVKIRLEQAREAAEGFQETKFEKLAHDILLTLEKRYNKINTARNDVPLFRTPLPSPEPMSSQESLTSIDSQDSSQQSM